MLSFCLVILLFFAIFAFNAQLLAFRGPPISSSDPHVSSPTDGAVQNLSRTSNMQGVWLVRPGGKDRRDMKHQGRGGKYFL